MELIFRSVVPVLTLFAAFYGIFVFMNRYEESTCAMTYMYDHPTFVRIAMPNDIANRFPKYELYVYGEGFYAEQLKQYKFTGIPVLFIHGNGGSYRQSRSIASIGIQMTHKYNKRYHFDFFSVHYQGELSGLYGGVLFEQTEFAQESIRLIKRFYPENQRIVLIGHSMGGVITRSLFLNSDFDNNTVSMIFTLATPHKVPVIELDSEFHHFYLRINELWTSSIALQSIPFVSIGGGERDFIVRSDLTSIDHFRTQHKLHVMTSAIPGAWLSTDHIQITWCKQVITPVVRTLLDSVDSSKLAISHNLTFIRQILDFHFVLRSLHKHIFDLSVHPLTIFPGAREWILHNEMTWRFSRNQVMTKIHILMPLIADETIIVIFDGLIKFDWVFACRSHSKSQCSDEVNLSEQAVVIPSRIKDVDRGLIQLNSSHLLNKSFTHILIVVAPDKKKVQVDILGERYKESDRNIQVPMPSLFERFLTFSRHPIKTFPLGYGGVFYNMSFIHLPIIIDSASLILETRICKTNTVAGHGLAKIHYTWSQEKKYYHISTSHGGVTVMPIKPHFLPKRDASRYVEVQLVLDPECSYTLEASFPASNILSQFIKFFGLQIPNYIGVILVCLLKKELAVFATKGLMVPLLEAISISESFVFAVLFPIFIQGLICYLGLTVPDISQDAEFLEHSGLVELFLVRIALFIIAMGAVTCVIFLFEFYLVSLAKIWSWIHKDFIMTVTREMLCNLNFQRPFIHLILFVSLAAIVFHASSAIALLIGLIIFSVKLFCLMIKCRAEEIRRGPSIYANQWNFYFLIVIFWFIAVLFTIPSLITWVQQLRFSVKLINDPFMYYSLLLIVAAAVFWQVPMPCLERPASDCGNHVGNGLAFTSAILAISGTFRLFQCICLVLLSVSFHQLYLFQSSKRKMD